MPDYLFYSTDQKGSVRFSLLCFSEPPFQTSDQQPPKNAREKDDSFGRWLWTTSCQS